MDPVCLPREVSSVLRRRPQSVSLVRPTVKVLHASRVPATLSVGGMVHYVLNVRFGVIYRVSSPDH